MMEMWLHDWNGNSILFARVSSVEDARTLWVKVAGLDADQNLVCFDVREQGTTFKLYEGDYVTDEC